MVIAAAVALASVAAAHPIHTTLTQVSYDTATREVTLMVRAFADDFSAAVSRHAGVGPRADYAVTDAASYAYLASTIALTDARGGALRTRWCGSRRTADVYWLCLRAAAPRGVDGARIVNRSHFELYDDQINIVQAVIGGRRNSVLFVRGDGPKRLTP